MVLNNECVRTLLLWLEENQTVDSSGRPDVIIVRKILSNFPDYPSADIFTSVKYLAQKQLISLRSGQSAESVAPRAYVITGITAIGYDYIAAVKDDTLWSKIKARLGSAALASVPAVIEVASKLL